MTPLLSHAQAADVARHGGVIAYPTEGVWGLGCNPLDEAAVTRLLTLKQRDIVKGLILIAAREAQLEDFIDYPALPQLWAEYFAQVGAPDERRLWLDHGTQMMDAGMARTLTTLLSRLYGCGYCAGRRPLIRVRV